MRIRVGIAVATVLGAAATLLAAGTPSLRPVLWGADAWAYLGNQARAGCLVAGIAAGIVLWMAPPFPARARGRTLLAGLAAPFFYVLRDRWHLLGDGQLWLAVLGESRVHHPHEPLAFAGAALATAGLRGAPPEEVVRRAELWSVFLGAIAVWLLALLAARLAPGRRARWAAFGLLLASGTTQFAFGYVEAYPLLWVFVILYLVLALGAVQGRTPVPAASLAWGLAAATHGTGFLLAPSLLAVHLAARPGPRVWLGSAILGAAPVVAAYAGLPHALAPPPGTTAGASSALRGAATLWGELHLASHGGAAWLLDQWNRWTLLGPLSVGLIVAGWLPLGRSSAELERRGPARAGAWMLALAAVGLALPALLLDTEGSRGASMDWDASAVAAVPMAALAALGVGILVESGAAFRRVIAAGVAVAAFGAASFVSLNATPAAGVNRVTDLMTSPAWTDRTRSLAAENVAAACRAADEETQARAWTVRAAELDPGSARKVTNAAILLAREGRHRRAAALYLALLEREEGRAETWFRLGRELEAVGSPDSARVAYGEAIRLDPRSAAPRTHLARLLLTHGNDPAARREAAALLQESLSLEPDQPGAEGLRELLTRLEAP